jgi:hypothetical protein
MEFDTTPLPWSLDCDGDLMAADRTLVAIIPAAKDRPILAAAPELLKHLKHMIWLVEVELKEDGGHIVANAKAAVAAIESK